MNLSMLVLYRTVKQLPQYRETASIAPSGEVAQRRCLDRLAAAGYRQVVTYHPADRFWRFQAYETFIFAMFSLLLAGFCFLRVAPARRGSR